MNRPRAPAYSIVQETPKIDPQKKTCPITGKPIEDHDPHKVDFFVGDKKVSVCSYDCMIKVKNLFNYLSR